MAENNGRAKVQQVIGAVIPRREPMASDPERGDVAAKAKGFLVSSHPLVKEVRSYFELMIGRLDDIKDNTGKKETRLSLKRGQVQNNSGGAADTDIVFDGPPPGVSWEVMRVVTEVSPAAATKGRIYIGAVGVAQNKVQVITDTQDYSDAPAGVLYVPPAQKLTVRFVALANGSIATAVIQVREFINPPVLEVGN